MRMLTLSLAVSMLFVLPAGAESPSGTWAMANGKVIVRVSECNGKGLCANIVGLREPTYKDGKRKIHRFNKSAKLRKRPLMGLPLVRNMRPQGPNKWTGKIYNPDDGNTYAATVTLSGRTMRLKGCVLGMLCKSQTLVRLN
jgi:uncharacterized protein (DUF2147 family)